MCNYCFIYDVTSEAKDSGNILQKIYSLSLLSSEFLPIIISPWWHYAMQIFSALLAFCDGNPLVTNER